MLFELRQTCFLIATAIIWGCTVVAQSMGMDSVDPFTFTAARMILGAVALTGAVFGIRKYLEKNNPKEFEKRRTPRYSRYLLLGGFWAGFCLFVAQSLQQFGLALGIGVGKSGFIASLYIVFIPLCGYFLGKKPRLLTWIAVAVACLGLWLLCVAPGSDLSLSAGDVYTLLCAIGFGCHILVIGYFVKEVDSIELSMMQFVVGAIFSTVSMLLFESPTWEGCQAALWPILWAGIMSNAIGFTFQLIGQRGMNETVVGIILSSESVVSVLAGWVVLNEVLSSRELFGCAVMAAAIIIAQLPQKTKNNTN